MVLENIQDTYKSFSLYFEIKVALFAYIHMIGEFAKRPTSRHVANFRPVTAEASNQSKKQSDECFDIAKKHMIKKQYEQALKHYTNATIHNPKNYKAFCNMGKIYKEVGRYAQARNCYNRALFANPNDPITLYNLANLERISGNDDLSIFLYAKVANLKQKQNVDIGELYYDALINQGICYKNLQLFDQAIECNDKAIAISPNDECAHFNKGMCLLKKIYAVLKKSFTNVKKKLCKDAQNTFNVVLKLNPNKFVAKVASIELLYLNEPSQEAFKQSLTKYEQLQKIAPPEQKFQLSLKIKYCQNQLKKIDEAKIILPPQQDIVERPPTATNKYDQQTKPQQKVVKQSAGGKRQNKQSNKQSNVSSDIKNKIKQGKSVRPQIDQLIDAKKFDQAFNIVQMLPDGLEKYQCEIIINYCQCVESQNQAFLQSAISIYNQYILKNNMNTVINKDLCTQKGHQIIANMLTVYGNYTQASKHYEVLLQLVQDKKFTKDNNSEQKIKEFHAQLGICYAERGLIQEAINQYKKSYEMQQDNYFSMTNLCGLLIQDNRQNQARQYYEDYLKKNGGDNIADKVVLVDSLLNISVCVRQTPQEEAAVQKALQAVNKHFPTYKQVKQKLHQQAILGLYLRQSQILQKKVQSVKPNSTARKQLYEKMLQNYLTCLQFQNCPDREAIYINIGILFYLGGCYANALNFYQIVTVNRKLIANNIALTCLHLQQFQIGFSCLQFAVQQNPENIVYATNLQIAKWMSGLNKKPIFQKYDCKCELMCQTRVIYGLWMLDQLTKLLQQNKVKAQNDINSTTTVQQQVQKLTSLLFQRSQNVDLLAERSETEKSKIKLLARKLDQHMKQYHKQKQQKPKLVSDQILDMCLKFCQNAKQFETQLSDIFDKLSTLDKKSPSFTAIQSLISIFLLVNAHIKQSTSIMQSLIQKKLIETKKTKTQHFQTADFKKQNGDYISKTHKTDYTAGQLKLKIFQDVIKQTQCLLENMTFYLVQLIQNVYYQQPENILSPFVKQYRHPHCERQQLCIRCKVSAASLYSSIFGNQLFREVKLSKNRTVSQQISQFNQEFKQFVISNLDKQSNNVFSKATKQFHIKLQDNTLPIFPKTHHKTFANVVEFVKKIDSSFVLADEPNKLQKGVRVIYINKSIGLEMFWGEGITPLDRYCNWLGSRPTNFTYDAIFLLGDDLKDLEQIFQNGSKSTSKISESLYKE